MCVCIQLYGLQSLISVTTGPWLTATIWDPYTELVSSQDDQSQITLPFFSIYFLLLFLQSFSSPPSIFSSIFFIWIYAALSTFTSLTILSHFVSLPPLITYLFLLILAFAPSANDKLRSAGKMHMCAPHAFFTGFARSEPWVLFLEGVNHRIFLDAHYMFLEKHEDVLKMWQVKEVNNLRCSNVKKS